MKEMYDKKNIYKQTLLYQQAMKDKNHHNFGKMTKQEKNLNKMDLYAFRNKDANIYSMVPGVNNLNTVGTHPMNRTIKPLELSTAWSMEILPKLYSNIEDHPVKDAMYNRKIMSWNGSWFEVDPYYVKDQRMDTPETRVNKTVLHGYNPITNPMP